MGESWKRPIFQFSFAVKDINGILKYDHASGADFEHFSNETPGWGCNDFIPYPIEESIIFNNETSIEILVSGVQTNQEATFIHQDLIPSAQSSFTFGPSSCAWKLTLNHNNGWISAYLNPVLSELENRATDSAPRMISALTVKFLDSTTLQPFVSKCITGGFVFDGQPAGWHNFYQANVLDNCLVYIEVTWDPKLFSKLTRDKHRLSVVDVISDSHLENIATLNAQVSALRDQLIYVKPIVDRTLHSEERTLQLMEELRTSRTEDQEMNYHRTKLCELKLKLIKIRGMMESDHQTTECLKFDSMNVDVLPLLEINANLELKIANLLGELSCANSQLVDQGLLEPLEDAVSLPEFADTLALKIRNAQEENLKALDANFTLQGKVLETKCEQMAVIAELSMVVCGCDVALADLYELKDQVEQPHQEFDKAISDLEIVIPNLISMRKNILETPFHSEIGGRPSVPPPILPSSNPIRTKSLFLDIKETKSPKELPMESVESFPHADLVKRIEELKDLLNARDRISLIDAEPWTPIKEKDEELEEFFRNLPRNRSYFTIFMYYCTWFLSLFIIFSGFYSTFFIICDSKEMSTRSHTHPFVYYHGVCSKIVNPIFRNVKDVLHHNVAMFVENSHLTISAFDAEIVAQYIRVWIQDKVNKSLEKVLARNDIPISATLALEAKVKTSSTLLSTVLEAVESKDIYVSLESMVEKTSSNDDPAVHIKLTESPTLSSEYEKIKGKVVPKSFSEGEVNGFDKNVTLNTILDDAADVKRKLSLEASTTVLDAILEAVKSKDMYVSLESSIEKTSRNDDANGLDKKITSNMSIYFFFNFRG
jgi:vacuolar-type H+-ATPase subunit D/Vma8